LNRTQDVIVVGAGPAGLCAAHYLKQRQLSFAVLERAAAAGATFSAQPAWMRLLSPAPLNRLPGMERLPEAYTPMRRYGEMLERYAQTFPIHYETPVERIATENGAFFIETPGGTWESRAVVIAAGIFGHPFYPEIQGLDSARHIHFADLNRHPEPTGQRILIIGNGISAFETAFRWRETNEVSISGRTPKRSFPRFLLGLDAHYFFRPLESLHPRKDSRFREGIFREWYRALRNSMLPPVSQVQGERVTFSDCNVRSFDLILMATGFRPAAARIKGLEGLFAGCRPEVDGLQSLAIANLYFMGIPLLRTFASGYVRGFPADAQVVVRQIHNAARRMKRSTLR